MGNDGPVGGATDGGHGYAPRKRCGQGSRPLDKSAAIGFENHENLQIRLTHAAFVAERLTNQGFMTAGGRPDDGRVTGSLPHQNPRRFKLCGGIARLDLPAPVADGEAHLVDGEAQRGDPVGVEMAQGAGLQRLP